MQKSLKGNQLSKVPVYRVVVTPSELNQIIASLKSTGDLESLETVKEFVKLEYLIANDLIKPAYFKEIKEKISSESLGLDSQSLPVVHSVKQTEDPAKLYAEWQIEPSSLSIKQLIRVKDYRYSEGLMSPEELKVHEDETGITSLKEMGAM